LSQLGSLYSTDFFRLAPSAPSSAELSGYSCAASLSYEALLPTSYPA